MARPQSKIAKRHTFYIDETVHLKIKSLAAKFGASNNTILESAIHELYLRGDFKERLELADKEEEQLQMRLEMIKQRKQILKIEEDNNARLEREREDKINSVVGIIFRKMMQGEEHSEINRLASLHALKLGIEPIDLLSKARILYSNEVKKDA